MRSILTMTLVLPGFVSTALCAVEKAAPPKEVVAVLEFYAGNWSVTGMVGNAPLKGTASFRMPAGRHCVLGTVNCRSEQGPFTFSLVSGWDSSTGWYTEQGSGADGGVYSVAWSKVSENVDEGLQVEAFEGKKVTSKLRLERKGKDSFVVVCSERKGDNETLPPLTLVYQRAAKENRKPEKKE